MPNTWRNYTILQSHKQTHLNYTIKFCSFKHALTSSNAFLYNHAWFLAWRTELRSSDCRSYSLRVTDEQGWNFMFPLDPLSRCHILAIFPSVLMEMLSWPERNGSESAAERKRTAVCFWKVCDILKELWRWVMTNLINSSLSLYMSWGYPFYHSVMRISFRHEEDQMELHYQNVCLKHLLFRNRVPCTMNGKAFCLFLI